MTTPEDTELFQKGFSIWLARNGAEVMHIAPEHRTWIMNVNMKLLKIGIMKLITLHTQKAVDDKMASFGLKKGVKYKVMSTDKITVLEPQLTNPTKGGDKVMEDIKKYTIEVILFRLFRKDVKVSFQFDPIKHSGGKLFIKRNLFKVKIMETK